MQSDIIEFEGKRLRIFSHSDADESVVAEIFKWREYKAAEDIIRSTRSPILDVGAHIGIFSLYGSVLNPRAKIYAIEPEEENFENLGKNIKENGASNVRLFRLALCGRSGKRILSLAPDDINHRLVPEGEPEPGGDRQEVRGESLPDFIAKNGIISVGLLKMDIEGGEYEIFENMSDADFGRVENVILEYHSIRGKGPKDLERLLRENGFSVQIFPSRFEKGLGFIFARNRRLG